MKMSEIIKIKIKKIYAKLTAIFINIIRHFIGINIYPVVIYHSIGSSAEGAINEKEFRKQIEHLIKCNYSLLNISDAINCNDKAKKIATVTFDDGYLDNYELAFQMLIDLDVKATFFITTDYISNKKNISNDFKYFKGLKNMTWKMVQELSKHGMEIGSHSKTHANLQTLNLKDLKYEIIDSKKIIEDQLGIEVCSFAIPFGNKGTYSDKVLDILSEHYKACCFTHYSTNTLPIKEWNGMKLINRIEPKPYENIREFKAAIYGLKDGLKWIQRERR